MQVGIDTPEAGMKKNPPGTLPNLQPSGEDLRSGVFLKFDEPGKNRYRTRAKFQ
jgi:hypothetical protein